MLDLAAYVTIRVSSRFHHSLILNVFCYFFSHPSFVFINRFFIAFISSETHIRTICISTQTYILQHYRTFYFLLRFNSSPSTYLDLSMLLDRHIFFTRLTSHSGPPSSLACSAINTYTVLLRSTHSLLGSSTSAQLSQV